MSRQQELEQRASSRPVSMAVAGSRTRWEIALGVAVFVLFAIIGSSEARRRHTHAAKPTIKAPEGTVVAVTDGDTFKIMHDGKPLKVRLWGADAPEKAQPFGQKAKQFASDLVFGKVVKLEAKNLDRYGRTVGRVAPPAPHRDQRRLARLARCTRSRLTTEG